MRAGCSNFLAVDWSSLQEVNIPQIKRNNPGKSEEKNVEERTHAFVSLASPLYIPSPQTPLPQNGYFPTRPYPHFPARN